MRRSQFTNVGTSRAFRVIGERRGPVVIIAPHPDDETLGTGRLILKLSHLNITPAFIILTDGGGSHPNSDKWPPCRLGRLRRRELRRALARLGLGSPTVRHMGWRDGNLAEDGKKLRLRAILNELNARTVLVTSPLDHHPDHKAAFALASAAIDRRSMTLWTYAVWSRATKRANRACGRGRGQQNWAMKAHRSQNGKYISDDPSGFSFTPAMLSAILDADEYFGST